MGSESSLRDPESQEVAATRPDVSLVVSTVGRPRALRRLIESIQVEAEAGPSVELLVIDQSEDGRCLPLLREFDQARSDPGFTWRYRRTARGVSRGRNAGLALATGRLIMFPDDDAWFPGRTLARSVAHFDRHPDHVGLCTQLRDGEGRLSMLRWAPTARAVTKRNHHRTSIGSTMLFRTEAARAATGFDESLGPGADSWFGSCEDADFLLQVVATGATVWYDPSVVMHHRDSRRDGGADAETKALSYGCGQGHMWRRHRFPVALIVTLLLRRLFGSFLWNLRGRSDIGAAHRAWARGAVNGWLGTPPTELTAVAAPIGDGSDGGDLAELVDRNAPSGVEFGRSFSWRMILAPLGTMATFFLTALVARTLPPGDVTIFYGVLAALMIGPILGRFGLGQRAVRELAATRTQYSGEVAAFMARRHVVSTLFVPLLAAPVISFLFITGVSRDGFRLNLAALTTVILVAEASRLTISDVLTGLGMTGWAALLAHQFRAVLVTGAAIVHLLVAPGRLDLERLLGLMAVTVLVLAAVGFRRLWSLPHRVGEPDPEPRFRRLLSLGLPFLVVDLVVVVVARGDVWLAGLALAEWEAPLYGTASVLAVQIGVPIGLASVAMAPVVAGFVAQGRLQELERMLRSLSTAMLFLVGPILLASIFFGDDLLGLAYGDRYRQAHLYLVVLMVGNVTLAILGVSSIVLLMADRQWAAMSIASTWFAIAAPITIGVAYLFGPTGLALASAGTTIGLYLLLTTGVWFTTGIRLLPYPDPRRILVPAAIRPRRWTARPRDETAVSGLGR